MRRAESSWLYSRLLGGTLTGCLWLVSAQGAELVCVAPSADKSAGGTGSAAHAEYAGRVLFINGSASAQLPGGAVRALAKESPVCEGDTLLSGEGAMVQLHMADGGKLVLRSKTRMTIDTFANPTATDGSERFAVKLIEGGLRAITGLIGRQRKQNYLINTPTASIGIRGTDHEVFFVPTTALPPVKIADAGTYNRVFTGKTVLQSAAGQVLLGPNQVGFAPVTGASPMLLKTLPNFLGTLPTEIRGALQQQKTAKAASAETDTKSAATESAAATPAPAASNGNGANTAATAPATDQTDSASDIADMSSEDYDQLLFELLTELEDLVSELAGDGTESTDDVVVPVNVKIGNVTVDLNASADQTFTASFGSAYVGAHVTDSGQGLIAATGGAVTNEQDINVHLDAVTGLPAVMVNEPGNFNYQSQWADLLDFSWADVDGVTAMWGLYGGGGVVDPLTETEQAVNFHHFAFADAGATPPEVISSLSGTAHFKNIIGYTLPTSEAGMIGGAVQSLDVHVTLGADPGVTGYSINVRDGWSRDWTGNFIGFVPLGEFSEGKLPLNALCSGDGCGSGTGSGSAAGILIGNHARGLITTYGLGTTTGEGVAGAAVVSQDLTMPAPIDSAYVGTHVIDAGTGLVAATAGTITDNQNASAHLDLDSTLPVVVVDGVSGFNYQPQVASLLDFDFAEVDGALVSWGLYDGGIVIDPATGAERWVDFHHFAYAPGGATPMKVISSLAGSARFNNIVGYTLPTSEGGVVGGALRSLDVNVNLGANPGVTGYAISVQDGMQRDWTGSFTGFAPLADFGAGKLSLTARCTGTGCGSGAGTGTAAGILIGNNAKGLATTYGLGTSTGQGVAGAAVLSRP